MIIIKYLHFHLLSKNFRKLALYRLNSLNADIQLIVDGASASNPYAKESLDKLLAAAKKREMRARGKILRRKKEKKKKNIKKKKGNKKSLNK